MARKRNEQGKGEFPQGPFRDEVERVPRIEIEGDAVTVHDLRDSYYAPDGERELRWTTDTFDRRDLTNVYFHTLYFAKLNAIAHTSLAFEFSDGRVIVASAEIRPTPGQRYSPAAGMKKTFLICYMWMTERDALLQQMTTGDWAAKRMHMLESVLTHRAAIALFDACIARTNALSTHPEWYHTFRNSCTTNVFDLAQSALPGVIKSTPRKMLPGYLPSYLIGNGMVRSHGSVSETLDATNIGQRVRDVGWVEDFSIQLRSRSNP